MNYSLELEDNTQKSSESSQLYPTLSEIDSDCSNSSSSHITRLLMSTQSNFICRDFQEKMACEKGNNCLSSHQICEQNKFTSKPWSKFHLLKEYPELAIYQSQGKRINSSIIFS